MLKLFCFIKWILKLLLVYLIIQNLMMCEHIIITGIYMLQMLVFFNDYFLVILVL